jgi:hypothetical protein
MIFWLLVFLIIKHYIADFVLQFEYMVEQKGTYGRRGGLDHALMHGALTAMVMYVCLSVVSVVPAVVLGLIDSIMHYHIDYVKARWGTRDPNKQRFWIELGADQMAHYLFYIWLVWSVQDFV